MLSRNRAHAGMNCNRNTMASIPTVVQWSASLMPYAPFAGSSGQPNLLWSHSSALRWSATVALRI